MKIEKQNGVTMVALAITVIVLLILTSITVNVGTGLVRRTSLQNLKTDMMLIQAKAKEYVEQATFKGSNDELIGTVLDETTIDEKYLEQTEITDGLYYKLTKEDLSTMGLNKIETTDEDYYIIVYDMENIKVDVINTIGYTDENSNVYYSLTKLNTL